MLNFEDMPQKWRSFLAALDEIAAVETRLDCIGGFVVTQCYGSARETNDLDVVVLAPGEQSAVLVERARKGSELHRRYKLYLDHIAWVKVPENHEERLTEILPGAFKRLRLCVLDPYDIVLTKLERNVERDREDVQFLAKAIPLDPAVLKERYEKELRWQLGIPEREDLTLQFWMEMIQEIQRRR